MNTLSVEDCGSGGTWVISENNSVKFVISTKWGTVEGWSRLKPGETWDVDVGKELSRLRAFLNLEKLKLNIYKTDLDIIRTYTTDVTIKNVEGDVRMLIESCKRNINRIAEKIGRKKIQLVSC